MITARIARIYEEEQAHMDGKVRLTPIVSIAYEDENGFCVAATGYPLRKDSAIETIEDVLVRAKGEIERLEKTDVVHTYTDEFGEHEVLERDTIVAGSNIEGTSDKNIQVKLSDLQKHQDVVITQDTVLADIVDPVLDEILNP